MHVWFAQRSLLNVYCHPVARTKTGSDFLPPFYWICQDLMEWSYSHAVNHQAASPPAFPHGRNDGLLDAPQAWLWPELSRATCVSAANSSSSCRAQRGRQNCSQAPAVWLLLPSHHCWHLVPGVGTALMQQGLEHIWLWHCRKGRCQLRFFFLFILFAKLFCAGLARGLGIQKISENTCCPGNINVWPGAFSKKPRRSLDQGKLRRNSLAESSLVVPVSHSLPG